MEHKTPTISVVIPVYNRPAQLRQAMESVAAQTLRPLELLVGDDGSTDDTRAVARETARLLADRLTVRVLALEHSGRPGAVRNRCAAEAAGEYLSFLDSDDLWRPEKLARQIRLFEENPALAIAHTREEWNREGRILSQAKFRHAREGDLFADALKKCTIGPSTVMIKRELYQRSGGFREDLEIAEDYEYWLRLTAAVPVGYLDEPLTIKRAGHGDQLSEKYGQIEVFRIEGLQSLVDRGYFQGRQAASAAGELARKCRVYGKGCLKRDKTAEGRRYLDLSEHYDAMAGKPAGDA